MFLLNSKSFVKPWLDNVDDKRAASIISGLHEVILISGGRERSAYCQIEKRIDQIQLIINGCWEWEWDAQAAVGLNWRS